MACSRLSKEASMAGVRCGRKKIREVVGPVHVGPSWAIIAALAVCLKTIRRF